VGQVETLTEALRDQAYCDGVATGREAFVDEEVDGGDLRGKSNCSRRQRKGEGTTGAAPGGGAVNGREGRELDTL
jgi:hypothetical protein